MLDKNSNFKGTTISSTGNYMLVQFTTNNQIGWNGFQAYFEYIPTKPKCEHWFNSTTQILKSPDHQTINCSWVITAPSIDSTIIINFETFEVNLCNFSNFLQ